MNFKRRKFLLISSLSGLGFVFFNKIIQNQTVESADVDLNIPVNLAPEIPMRFVSVADTGTGTQDQYAVAQAMTRYHHQNKFDLVILAGDNIYNNGEIEKINAVFERPYQSLLKQGVKFHAALGNHDIRTDNGEPQVKYPGFNMQGRYYTFRRGSVQFFALDTNHNADWENQLNWLEQELTRSDAAWKIVFGHHQIYSSGIYGVNQPFIKKLTPIFQKHNVQLYINGHEHNYERTQPIKGTTYLICGAGAAVRPVKRSSWTAHSASELSFAAFDVYSDRIIISAINTKSLVFDRGIIKLTSS